MVLSGIRASNGGELWENVYSERSLPKNRALFLGLSI